MQRSMSNYLGDFQRSLLERRSRSWPTSCGGSICRRRRWGRNERRALADIELQKAREIAMAAQNIEAFKGMLGGL